jgi:hypothetical protein
MIEKENNNGVSEEPTKYEEDLGSYLHLKIEEQKTRELKIEEAIVPESVRHSGFWRRFHTHRRILVSRTANFLKDTRKMLIVWAIIVLAVTAGILLKFDRNVIGGSVFVVGIISNAFAWLAAGILSGIGLIPLVGPVLVSILSSSVLWLINALGYFVSVIAIKAGHGKAVLNYRLLVIVFLTGLVTGYVIARLIY